ncbi:ABC transporter permease [Nonomuraea insulae]|uniref:Autoinducer 2 import system permease protein LsrC n=1 Tax=Nonomuraea insulae TaxID=1616787 RepID=A0ABW1CFQ0_9ACTN
MMARSAIVRSLPDALRQDFTGVLVATVVLVLVVGVRDTTFLQFGQLSQVLNQAAVVGVLACAMAYLLAMRELDLSVGSVLGLSALCGALLIRVGLHPWAAAVLCVAAGALLGLVNGVLVDLLRLPSIVATLATLSTYRGLTHRLSEGRQVLGAPLSDPFSKFFGWKLAGLGVNFWALAIVVTVLVLTLRNTPFGYRIRSIGSNPEAARFSGIPIRRVRLQVFVLAGVMGGVAGALTLGYFGVADPNAGSGYELQAIAAAVIGGTPLYGGRASVTGAALGAVLLEVVRTALAYFRIDINWNDFTTGAVILLAVGLASLLRRRTDVRPPL